MYMYNSVYLLLYFSKNQIILNYSNNSLFLCTTIAHFYTKKFVDRYIFKSGKFPKENV